MNNIFNNAYFGKAYKTRDGRKALYISCGVFEHYLAIKGCIDTETYDQFGTSRFEDEDWNIISEYKGTAHEQADAFDDYWKANKMDARLNVLELNDIQIQQMKIELELAFMAGYNLKH